MSTIDVAIRARSIRPRRHIDYTSITNRRRKDARTPPVSSYFDKQSFKKESELTVKTYKNPPLQTSRRVQAEGNYSTLALSAIKIADPVFECVNTDDNTVFINQTTARRNILSMLMYGFGILVLGVSLFASVQTLLVNKHAQEQVQVLGEQTYSTDANGVAEGTGTDPAESPVSENALLSYVPQNPQDPRYIRIPSIGIISRVKTLGIDSSTGAVDAPRNIHDTGWYDGSVRPGSGPGTSLLLGHVSGWTSPGVFKKIDKLQKDDKIIIENGEGRTYTYHVYKSETLHLDDIDMNKVLATEKAGEHDVKLMTCAGNFDSQTEEYDSRTIIYARQIL